MPPPRGGALLRNLSDNYAHSGASLSGQNASGAVTENLTPQEQLLAGTLELDPENDPVIFTTDYGIQIKSHNAGEVPVSVNDPSGEGTVTVGSTNWNYISAGGYNWIIIGQYSSSSYSFNPSPLAANMYSGNNPDNTDAGNAIESASEKGLLQAGTITIPAFTNASVSSNGEIPAGCVLCICQTNIDMDKDKVPFGSNNNYKGSNLQTYIDTTYGGTSELSLALQKLPIIPQTLITLYNNITTRIDNAYLFPLAAINNTESFYIGTYLDSDAKRISGDYWWLRSGAPNPYNAYYVTDRGNLYNNSMHGSNTDGSARVRPSFILRLYT